MQYITLKAYCSILNTIGKQPIETGGILGEKNGIICEFYFDKNAKCDKCEYVPEINDLNKVIEKWHEEGLLFIGIAHSHPNGFDMPSQNDGLYAKIILSTNAHLKRLVFPIITIENDNVKISFYEFSGDRFKKIDIVIIN